MNRVFVSIGAPTEGGRLYPEYSASAGILAVTAEVAAAEWKYGVDIDGNIVFDLDAGRRLANFDIHIAKQLWPRGPVRPWPERPPTGTIIFSDETIERKSLNIPLRLAYDPDAQILDIRFGTTEPGRELELSKSCIALLAGSELVGFLLRGF